MRVSWARIIGVAEPGRNRHPSRRGRTDDPSGGPHARGRYSRRMGAPDPNASRVARTSRLPDLLRERILVLDGAMGTMIQTHELDEAAFRGDRFATIRATCGAPTTCWC